MGFLASLSTTGILTLLGGWYGVLISLATALVSKSLLESVNYIQHYGLVREPGSGVAHRHSWDTDKPVSLCLLWNVTRHAHHHARPSDPYWNLQSLDDSPKLRFGYMTTIILAFLPPVWHRFMAPRLREWDETFATAIERDLSRVGPGG
jgi:alkane 1-monooxygenase